MSFLVAGLFAGVILCQGPVAWLADRLGRLHVLLSCHALLVAALLAVRWHPGTILAVDFFVRPRNLLRGAVSTRLGLPGRPRVAGGDGSSQRLLFGVQLCRQPVRAGPLRRGHRSARRTIAVSRRRSLRHSRARAVGHVGHSPAKDRGRFAR